MSARLASRPSASGLGADRRSRRGWPLDLGAAYLWLAGILFAAGLTSLTFALFPPTPQTPRAFDLLIAIASFVLVVLLVTVLPHVRDDWGLDLGLAVAGLSAAAAVLVMPRAQGQLLVGFGVVLIGVHAAYFRPRRRLVALLVLMLTAYGVALQTNRQLPSPLYLVVVAGTVVVVAALISSMAQRMRDLAFRDSLTGVLNRRGLEVAIAPVAGMAAREGRPVTVGLIDLDGFKAYNDAHGHVAGDDFLIELTAAWRDGLRTGDLMARFGGDEFALVLPDSTPADAAELAERLRALHPGGWSVGFTEWQPGESLTDALTRADHDLYAEKRRRTET